MVHALRSRRVITPHGEQDATVVIEDGIITAVHPNASSAPTHSHPTEDLGSLALLPGLIDVHTHINEPGRTDWEGFATATRAAAAGGFTTVIDMPLNCLPETTNVAALELKREAACHRRPKRDFAMHDRLRVLGRLPSMATSVTSNRSRSPESPASRASSSTPAATASPRSTNKTSSAPSRTSPAPASRSWSMRNSTPPSTPP